MLTFLLLFGVISVSPIHVRDTPVEIGHAEGEKVNVVYSKNDKWFTLEERHLIRGETKTIIAAPPGNYLAHSGDSSIFVITEEGSPKPNPDDNKPKPEPEPDDEEDEVEPEPIPPGPVPILAKWLIFIEEQEDRPLHEAETNIITAVAKPSPDGKPATLNGMQVRVYDEEQSEATAYLRLKKNEDLPFFVLMESESVYRVFEVPKTKEAFDKIIRENVVR